MMRNKQLMRFFSAFMAVNILVETLFPTMAYALTGGPSQPEVESFEPASTSQMVDPFTGDFNYNIPLIDIDGYPVNISYHSGVTMDQEASWVGLGWNLNPGVVNRGMRGLPDDFSGETIERKAYIKDNFTFGIKAAYGQEYLGVSTENKKSMGGFGYNLAIGVNYNNYTGLGIESSYSGMFLAGDKFKNSYLSKAGFKGEIVGLSLDNSSKDGFSIKPRAGAAFPLKNKLLQSLGIQVTPNFSVGVEVNSRRGTQSLVFTHGVGIRAGKGYGVKQNVANGMSQISFSTPSYTPSSQFEMENNSKSFIGRVGIETGTIHRYPGLSGYFANSKVASVATSKKAYGYYYSQSGKDREDALLDLNREKDGAYSEGNPTLAIPVHTYDVLNISGQGTSGMFRPFRNDIGVLKDPVSVSNSDATNLGVEVAFGKDFKFAYNNPSHESVVKTGGWVAGNGIAKSFEHVVPDYSADPDYEPYYFKQVGEKSKVNTNFVAYKELNNALRPKLTENGTTVSSEFSTLVKVDQAGVETPVSFTPDQAVNHERVVRNQFISSLTANDAAYCLQRDIVYYNVTSNPQSETGKVSIPRLDATGYRQAHHITELSVTNPGGAKYVYGIPAYNQTQIDVSFTNSEDPDFPGFKPTRDCNRGLVTYDGSSTFANPREKSRNFRGNDHFYNATKMPGYAHSYLLTAVLSPDYIDVNNNGPDNQDYGNYTKLDYYRTSGGSSPYKWRVPTGANQANFNEGYKSDKYDDAANFMYGEKEIWHVRKIEGRNHVAYFYISQREDGLGVSQENGGVKNQSGLLPGVAKSYKLDKIELYVKGENGSPSTLVKTVHFEYDYSLCPEIENNTGAAVDKSGTVLTATADINNPAVNVNLNKGKLTLKRIYFSYGSINSIKGRINSYVFEYNGLNPSYNMKAYDRWGSYKPIITCAENGLTFNNADYPYTDQGASTNDYASAWSLTDITMPSGGKISIQYESDDYAYVQNRKAMSMLKISGFGDEISDINGSVNNWLFYEGDNLLGYNFAPERRYPFVFFEIPSGYQINAESDILKQFLGESDDGKPRMLYYNALVNLGERGSGHFEYVRGYAEAEAGGLVTRQSDNKLFGYVKLKLNEGQQPISKSAWQLARIHLPHLVYPGSNLRQSATGEEVAEAIIRGLLGFIYEAPEMMRGINNVLFGRKQGQEVNLDKSWIRITNLSGAKKGGGCRVKKITMSDNWSNMGGAGASTNLYGQEYEYTMKETYNGQVRIVSSGVAAYEPGIGNDESPMRQPVTYNKNNAGIPDDEFYAEEPFGESLFPAPSVGYSRVTVKNLQYEDVTKNATGKVVHEFYTARDFPVITKNTGVKAINVQPSYIFSFMELYDESSLTTSQGYQIELNDMHGKPKATWNFRESDKDSYDNKDAFSGVEYKYFVEDENAPVKKLKNTVKVATGANQVSDAMVGVESDMILDSREMQSKMYSSDISFNNDNVTLGTLLLPIFMFWPDAASEVHSFRSVVISRAVYRYGILKETIAHEEGAKIAAENVLYDAKTGEVLLTKTKNEFKDDVFNTTIPSHWVEDYAGMGAVYENTGVQYAIVPTMANTNIPYFNVTVNGSNVSPLNYLSPGDEVIFTVNGVRDPLKKWVYKSASGNMSLIDNGGTSINLHSTNTYAIKVLNSGKQNMPATPLMQFTSMRTPLNTTSSGFLTIDEQRAIINAVAYDYKDKWRNETPKPDCSGILAEFDLNTLKNEFRDVLCPMIYNLSTHRQLTESSHNLVSNVSITPQMIQSSNATLFKSVLERFYQCAGSYPTLTAQTNISLSVVEKYDFSECTANVALGISFGIANQTFYLNGVSAQAKSTYSGVTCPTTYETSNHNTQLISNITSLNQFYIIDYDAPKIKGSYWANPSLQLTLTLDGNDANEINVVYTNPTNVTKRYTYPSPPFTYADLSSTYYSFYIRATPPAACEITGYISATTDLQTSLINAVKGIAPTPSSISQFHIYRKNATLINPNNPTFTSASSPVITTSTTSTSPICNQYNLNEKINPFVWGLRGNWRQYREYAYYENRIPEGGPAVTTNIRKDGTYKTFTSPIIWDNVSGKWQKQTLPDNWLTKEEITRYNPWGQQLESVDAIGRYSAMQIGYQNTLPVAVANNASLRQIGVDNMEEYKYPRVPLTCRYGHFNFHDAAGFRANNTHSHTGIQSIEVTSPAVPSNPVLLRDIFNTNVSCGNGVGSEFLLSECDRNGWFNPLAGKYVISCWVKVVENTGRPLTSSYAGTNGTKLKVTVPGYSPVWLSPEGPVIEGWQRVYGTFDVGANQGTMSIELVPYTGTQKTTYFDDLRVHPLSANMKSYVYDPSSRRLMAELDENNYATIYEYNAAGSLIRVKKETENGIVTVKETRTSQKKQ